MKVLIRGAGEMASAVACRLHDAQQLVALTELARPLCVRRRVSFADAVHAGVAQVAGLEALRVDDPSQFAAVQAAGQIPLLIDDALRCLDVYGPDVLVDAILAKKNYGTRIGLAPIVVALGPGFRAGLDADAVVETQRGPTLGHVLYEGLPVADTAIPAEVDGHGAARVLRAPIAGEVEPLCEIGQPVEPGQLVARVSGEPVHCQIGGVLRGMAGPGTMLMAGQKLGDVDPRGEAGACGAISDKAQAIADGVWQAIQQLRDD